MEYANKVVLIGDIVAPLEYSYESHGEKFFKAKISIRRTSGVNDFIELCISEFLISEELSEKTVSITGRLATRNEMVSGRHKLLVYVFVNEIAVVNSDTEHKNEVTLEGFVGREVKTRIVYPNRNIADFKLIHNRKYGNKTSYIPTIAWGRKALQIKMQCEGNHSAIRVCGRIQSREYIKDGVTMTTCELSVSDLNTNIEEKEFSK